MAELIEMSFGVCTQMVEVSVSDRGTHLAWRIRLNRPCVAVIKLL